MAIQQEWFTVEEAAEYLRVSKRTIYNLCKEGRLIGYRAGNRRPRRFRKEDLDNVLQREEMRVQESTYPMTFSDPVLAKIWDNEADAAYDNL